MTVKNMKQGHQNEHILHYQADILKKGKNTKQTSVVARH